MIAIGVGPSRLVVKCCSDPGKPAGFVAMGREEACVRFATAPTCRIPGIGAKTADRLAELGLCAFGHLQKADEASGDALRRERRALSDGACPVRTARPSRTEQGAAKSVSAERTFDEDVADLARLEMYLRVMARELCEGLERRGRRGRTIAIKVRLDDWTTVTRARTVDARTNEPVTVIEVAVELRRA